MHNPNNKPKFWNKATLTIITIVLMVISALALFLVGNINSNQSVSATPAQVRFFGKYCIDDGDWKDIVEGEHISSTKGDVRLRGNFHLYSPGGEYIGVFSGATPIAFYTDHINLTFYEGDNIPYVIDNENPRCGESACGVAWTPHAFKKGAEWIEILVHNPHAFGNENAIDEMLAKVAFRADIEFDKGILEEGEVQRNIGLFFVIISFMVLGTGLFCSLIHIKKSKSIWLLGALILSTGVYFIYSSIGVCFWSSSVISNTMLLGLSMMFYMFFLTLMLTSFFKQTKTMGSIISIVLGISIIAFCIVSITSGIFFYDTWLIWGIVQSVVNLLLLVCLVKELIHAQGKDKWFYAGGILPLVAFALDALSAWLGWWQGGVVSASVFILLFVVAMVVVLRIIPNSINAVVKAKEMEAEKILLNTQLAESRVSIMISQIRPHFIYNTLGSIEQLCELDPPKAGELVHNFAKYLRGNFGELDNPKPILMSQEMEHVHHYISIENVRFPDMTFTFEMNSNDFHIPALTVQPIVENAIKHGLMKLQKGGTIRVLSYETDTDYCILVEDDGAGFDTSVLLDERKHVGLRNIRERLTTMVNGSLAIESEIGVGTKVRITIPKGGEI